MIHARLDYQRIQDPEGKIGEDEPVFLLRGQDPLFIPILADYITRFIGLEGRDGRHNLQMDPIVSSLIEHMGRALKYQDNKRLRVPDMPRDAVREF